MSKYKLLEVGRGLKEFADSNEFYSPDGNKMIVFRNGMLGGQMFYDSKSQLVYALTLKPIEITDEDKDWLDGVYAKDWVENNMNYKDALEYMHSKENTNGESKESK